MRCMSQEIVYINRLYFLSWYYYIFVFTEFYSRLINSCQLNLSETCMFVTHRENTCREWKNQQPEKYTATTTSFWEINVILYAEKMSIKWVLKSNQCKTQIWRVTFFLEFKQNNLKCKIYKPIQRILLYSNLVKIKTLEVYIVKSFVTIYWSITMV